MKYAAELLLKYDATIGEGALWDASRQILFWVDIIGQKVFAFHPATGENRQYDVGHDVGTVVVRDSGGLMLAVENGFASLDLGTGTVRMLREVEAEIPTNRFNDGKCDPRGRFWAGTMDYDYRKPDRGSVYVLDRDLSVRKAISPVSCSNGLVWTGDRRTMYYIDTLTSRVDRFDYDDETGAVRYRRPAVIIPPELGLPDGMAIDERGFLWVALYGGGAVGCWDPQTGGLIDMVRVPGAKLVTSCAFGGPDLDVLYITSANPGLDDAARREQPNAGSLFHVALEIKGTLTHGFAG